MYFIDYNTYRSVNSFNSRVRSLVLHYTAGNFKVSIEDLTGQAVSSHYLVPDPKDQTYIDAGFKDIKIFNLVDEAQRAWHAGLSGWSNRENINDTSIGIEIVNLASEKDGKFTFPPYNPSQIQAVIQLCANIIQRYPDITPTNIVGHSDIAVGRKSDPGAAFPWEDLYKAGIGAWYDNSIKKKYIDKFSKQGLPNQSDIVSKLKTYGYNVKDASSPDGYQKLIRAFQLHFRQKDYSGKADIETVAILYALVEKYFEKPSAIA